MSRALGAYGTEIRHDMWYANQSNEQDLDKGLQLSLADYVVKTQGVVYQDSELQGWWGIEEDRLNWTRCMLWLSRYELKHSYACDRERESSGAMFQQMKLGGQVVFFTWPFAI